MTDDALRWTALHESGHSYAAYVLGREVGGLSVVPGQAADGVSFCGLESSRREDWDRLDMTQPLVLWPPAIRSSFEGDAIITAAGDAAVDALFWAAQPGPGRRPEPVHVAAGELVVSEPVRLRFFSGTDRPHVSDEEALATLVFKVYGSDPTGLDWLGWVAAETRRIVVAGAEQIERLAAAAMAHGHLTGAAIKSILAA